MDARERREYIQDGLSAERRRKFLVADEVALEWQRRQPSSLDGYFELLEALQKMFGPLPHSLEPWAGSDFRL